MGGLLFTARAKTGAAPEISGVVSAASYSGPIEPGSLVSIFGSGLAASAQSAQTAPLPEMLAGTTVTFDGIAAPLLFVSLGQINAQVPSEVVLSEYAPTSSMVIVSTLGGSSPPFSVTTFGVGPGVFTQDSSGCGAAAVLNITSDGVVSLNSTTQSAAPGDFIALFGTGLGTSNNLPPDGSSAANASPFTASGVILLGRSSVITPSYAGLAPMLVGVDQINFQIPSDAPQGCNIPLTVDAGDLLSPRVTISINSNRGQCVDPPLGSYGEVVLEKTVASGTSNDGESDTFKALFLVGPGLEQPLPIALVPGTSNSVETPVRNARVCPIPGEFSLSAGAITIEGPAGTNAVVQPTAEPSSGSPASSGVEYDQILPDGFVQPGQHTVTPQSSAPPYIPGSASSGGSHHGRDEPRTWRNTLSEYKSHDYLDRR